VSVAWTSPYPRHHPRQRFDPIAVRYGDYAAVCDRLDPRLTRWLTEQIPGGGRRALDLGCGPGRHIGLVAGRYDGVLAVDPSVEMLEIAARVNGGVAPSLPGPPFSAILPRPPAPAGRAGRLGRSGLVEGWSLVEFALGGINVGRSVDDDAEPHPAEISAAENGRFELVLAVHTLRHIGPASLVLPRVRDLVAPGGRLVVVDTVADRRDWADPLWHVQRAADTAHAALHLGATIQDEQVITGLLLDPEWLAIAAEDPPPSPDRFCAAYAAAFPGAEITIGELGALVGTCVWTHKPAAALAAVGSQR
jgi:SAM-dependent methyltransferase